MAATRSDVWLLDGRQGGAPAAGQSRGLQQFMSPLKNMPRGAPANTSKNQCLLTLIPFMVFCISAITFSFLYHALELVAWIVFTLTLLFSVVYVLMASDGSAISGYIGTLSLVGTILGLAVGLYAYGEHFAYVHQYESLRHYEGVNPAEAAAARQDAGSLTFIDTATVDGFKAVGMKYGDVYCAAPIRSPASTTRSDFWAVGLNCCGERREFHCDDAQVAGVHSGAVVLDTSMLVTVRDSYVQAVRLAESQFNLERSENPILVRWVQDPKTIQTYEFGLGMYVLATFATIHVLASYFFARMILKWGGHDYPESNQNGAA